MRGNANLKATCIFRDISIKGPFATTPKQWFLCNIVGKKLQNQRFIISIVFAVQSYVYTVGPIMAEEMVIEPSNLHMPA